ncbi:MAG: hypothetical protein E6H67_05715 [Betaproteobacteria bacterium]|nr:MAG: hypothetical protein E6H67_05715 [Betaproteobacteria bacterium]
MPSSLISFSYYNEIYPTGTKDFSAMLAAMKSKNPDFLLFAGYTGDATVVARQVAEGDDILRVGRCCDAKRSRDEQASDGSRREQAALKRQPW